MKKRGISPVIATVLLIAIAVVVALIAFMWLRGINEEAITKFNTNTNVKIVCEQVSFEADYSSGTSYGNIYVTNTGNVPIYKMKAKIFSGSSHSTEELSSWPEFGINGGGVGVGNVTLVSSGSEILLIPVLLGKTENGNKAYTCEDRYGVEIVA